MLYMIKAKKKTEMIKEYIGDYDKAIQEYLRLCNEGYKCCFKSVVFTLALELTKEGRIILDDRREI